ncbi:hypothetical protein Tco_0828345 [Tanacetum coccineum]
MLKRCEDTKLAQNWEKSHFMVKEGIVLAHKIFRKGIEVDTKIDVISKLPHPTTVKGIRSFLGHAGFYQKIYQRLFQNLSTHDPSLREKHSFHFFRRLHSCFSNIEKEVDWKLQFFIAPNWDNLLIHTMTEAQSYFTTREGMLAVVVLSRSSDSYLINELMVVFNGPFALLYLFNMMTAKQDCLRWGLNSSTHI